MTDKYGAELSNGTYVHFQQCQENPNTIPDHVPQEIDGWVFWMTIDGERVLGLFTNDRDNNIHWTGLYFEDDGTPCEELMVA